MSILNAHLILINCFLSAFHATLTAEAKQKWGEGMARYIDLTQGIETGMPVFPGDRETNLVQTKILARDGHNNHRLEIGMHTGTHIDVPLHMFASDQYVSDYPPQFFVGPGCLLDVRNQQDIFWRPEYQHLIQPDSIVLLCSGHDRFYGSKEYFSDHPRVSQGFARRLVQMKVKMLGIDWPSPDRYPFPVHKMLLAEQVFLLENLTNLHQLPPYGFEVFAFPLKIRADGALVRAVARVAENWDNLNATTGGREQADYPTFYRSSEARESSGGE